MKDTYNKTVLKTLQKELNIKNVMATPKVQKIHVNSGIGSYLQKSDKNFDPVLENIARISGQKPVVRKAKKAISNFKLREGMPVGLSVNLRGGHMYDFLSRMINIVLPRIRDFRGISVRGFDGHGNYSLGIKEVTVFPEVNPENLSHNHGVQITINTTAKTDREGYLLLKSMGFPFRDEIHSK